MAHGGLAPRGPRLGSELERVRLATLADDERDGEVELASVSDIVAMAGAWAGALGIGVLEDDPPA